MGSLVKRRNTLDKLPSTPRKVEAGTRANGPTIDATGTSWRLPAEAYSLGYLITGTTLAVLGQVVTNQGAFDPSTQLVAWTKYACTFVLSLTLQLLAGRGVNRSSSCCSSGTAGGSRDGSGAASGSGGSPSSNARKAAWLTAAIGLLDTLSYGLNCLGFAMCGSALSMVVFAACGQVFTALTRRALLRKSMTAGQTLGVCLVVVGLVVRSAGRAWAALLAATAAAAAPAAAATAAAGTPAAAPAAAATSASAAAQPDGGMAAGVGLIMLSALGYSLLGCLYEWLSALRGAAMSHAAVATSTSATGLLATSAFQLLYTRPRWRALVAERMAARGLTWGPVLRLYGVFGALFTAHSLVQGVVLQRSGATAVGIISALRAAAVTLASGALFCSPAAPQQCLTPASAASAAVVTAGALLWTMTGPRKQQQAPASVGPPGGQETVSVVNRSPVAAKPAVEAKHGKEH